MKIYLKCTSCTGDEAVFEDKAGDIGLTLEFYKGEMSFEVGHEYEVIISS